MYTFNKNEDFIFEILHDLKAPIIGMDFALKNTSRDNLLDEIYKINKHNLNYIENMLSSYSLSKGKYIPKFEIVNLVTIVKEEIEALKYSIIEKSLRTIISIDKLDDSYIISDKYLIRQIILNLLTNAVKYAPCGGDIKIVFEKTGNKLSICFSNPKDKENKEIHSSKMGLEIIKRKLKALKGKIKINANKEDVCFNIIFTCA